MKISSMYISNFKSIKRLEILDIDYAFILVGKNGTGKSAVIDALRAVTGDYEVRKADFKNSHENIEIGVTFEFTTEALERMYEWGVVTKAKSYDEWEWEFITKFPTFNNNKVRVVYKVTPEMKVSYNDENGVENEYIKNILPKLYYIDHTRNLEEFQNGLINMQYDEEFLLVKENVCLYDKSIKCSQCFKCIEEIKEKKAEELSVYETTKLIEYKIFEMNLGDFANTVNKYLRKNGSQSKTISYEIDMDAEKLFKINTIVTDDGTGEKEFINSLSAGTKSIYLLSLIEAYTEEKSRDHSLIMIEDPEIFLHPQLQKVASEILYRLSKKNQVIFSTYSPNMIFNFSSRQIKQVILDEEYNTSVIENTDIDIILDDLGYTANDLMNVSFVFIVEGKQDSNRLPMLLEKYYSEMRDDDGRLNRISIIPTNSCTNIKTYANLKYINKLYLKDQFLMIRDSDGKNPKYLVKQLCSYYSNRKREDVDNLPNVTPKNVLVLKYYSFENYFLDPKVMTEIGVIKSEDEFYNILYQKYRDYLHRLPSFKRLIRTKNVRINSSKDIKQNLEAIKIYVRGHNLFDIFYGKYRNNEDEIIRKYIEAAPRDNFKDILDTIDSFVYFENRKKDID
ncbi:MAG: ATP-binding protein [Lachnospiraceae bacterium]|nr:ATP-binding protein [Lachnospiraceae bacterium]MDE6699090.1 ATP-binding protein [Lachnospiraceae bacterium]